jgi:PAS domain S-box-containing protein
MREHLRKSGIDVIGDVPWGTHICQFYQTKEDLMEILITYFKAGLENNEFCLWVTSQPVEVEDAEEALKRAVPDFNTYLEKGQIEIIPYTDWFIPEGFFDSKRVASRRFEKLKHALESNYAGMRLSGNTTWLEKENWSSFIEFKEQTDKAMDIYRMINLCTYFLDRHNAAEIIDVVVNHQFALIKSEGIWKRIDSPKRKQAEETAIQATKNWEYTFDAVPDLIFILDTECRIIRANKAMAARLGVTPEECAGLTCYRAVHGMDKPPSFCPHRQLLKDGLEHTAEVCEDCLGGYFLVSVSPLYDSKGKLIGSIHVACDINERKKAEKALQESEEKYRYIVETANEGIWILDAEARTTYVNEKMAEMLGYGQKEMIGRSLLDFADEEGEAIFKPNLEKRRQGISEVYESKLICKDDSPLWTLICAKALFDKGGRFTGSLGMLTDITRRNQEEHRIRRYNRILEGINRIFGSIVKAETEEELGVACLSVAVDVTSSQIGFVGEVTTDGLMHDVAISDSGWDECLMYDKTGHRRLPGDHIIYGLYGRVIKSGKSFFTNDPRSHPDSIGLPEGHPPLRSFLGVPLILDGITIGILGVANREGGYSCEQQEDLEAIASAVTQALQRKKAEQERAQAEEALIRSEKRFRTLAENSPDMINRFDRQSRHLYANPVTAVFYGHPQEEITGKTHSELGMDPEKVKLWAEHHEKVFTTGKPQTMESRYTSLQGKENYFNTRIVPEFVDGEVVSILSISRDITDIKKAEVKLKETLDNSDNLVKERTSQLEKAYRSLKESEKGLTEAQKIAHLGNWDWNIITGELYGSDESYRIFGLSPQEFGANYHAFLSCVHPDDREFVNNAVKEALHGKACSIDHRIVLPSGEERTVHNQGEVVFDEENNPVRMRGTVQDITERKQTEKTLANIENARKKEIHHRIKNNLQVISSLLDLQAEKFMGRKCVEDLEVLNAFRESQDRVISIALIHEELHEGKGTDTLNFPLYLQRLVENLFRTYTLGNVDISLSMDLEENLFFDMDAAVPLGLIVNELVSNSLKYAFQGREKGIIQIKLSREENRGYINSRQENKEKGYGNTRFILAVSDNGVGMPESFSLENSDTLGIQLITTLVDQLDGELELKKDSGTEFIIRFAIPDRK